MQSDQGPASLERTGRRGVSGHSGPKLPGRRVTLMLILLVAWIATFFQGNTGAAAERACYESIKSELRDYGSISFTDVTRSGRDPIWTINMTANVQSSQGTAKHVEYVCRTRREPGSTDWHVESLSR
jgi:hypothetical protein